MCLSQPGDYSSPGLATSQISEFAFDNNDSCATFPLNLLSTLSLAALDAAFLFLLLLKLSFIFSYLMLFVAVGHIFIKSTCILVYM
jgi:hypothetical protein